MRRIALRGRDGLRTLAPPRASDPLYEVGMTLGGNRQEDASWVHTLSAVAAHFGAGAPVDTRSICVDRRRQWSRARNVWHNPGIRSGLHMAVAPFRVLSRPSPRGAKA